MSLNLFYLKISIIFNKLDMSYFAGVLKFNCFGTKK
jgi:hypothetical protein